MSSRTGTVALLLAALTLLLASACGTSEEPDGRYSALLRLVPDQPRFRDGVTIVDYEAIRALPGYEASRPAGAAGVEVPDERRALADALQQQEIAIPLREVLGVGWEYLPDHAANWKQGFGFGLDDINLALTAGIIPPRTLYAISGDFDPSAIEDQLRDCADCVEGEQRDHRGQRYFTWGEGQILPQRLSPPAFDDLGRGGSFVLDANYVLRSNFIDDFEASIDASQGRSALLGDDDLALLADELDALDLLALFVSGRTLGPEYAAELIENVSGNAIFEERVIAAWDVPAEEKLTPYGAFAVGVGVSDGKPFTIALLAYESDEAATANVQRFESRLETGLTVSGDETWSESIDSAEVTVRGRLLVATLRGRSHFAGLVNTPGLPTLEALLAHH